MDIKETWIVLVMWCSEMCVSGGDVRIYGVSALWLSVILESVHLYCTCICLLVWRWVCARARACGCVWLSLTASMGTRFILTLIMSKRLAMPLSHFSISSILPVRLGYTFSSLLPFLPSLNHQCSFLPICPSLRLSQVSTLPPTFCICVQASPVILLMPQ